MALEHLFYPQVGAQIKISHMRYDICVTTLIIFGLHLPSFSDKWRKLGHNHKLLL